MRRHPQQEFERSLEIRSTTTRLEKEHFPDDPQHMASSFPWRNEFFDFITKKYQPDFVIVPNSRKRQNRSNLGSELPLGLSARPEQSGTADVHDQHQSQ